MAVAAGVVKPDTPVVTTVHPLQLLDEDLPWARHDVLVDYIATPDEVIHCQGQLPQPTGIYWEDLDEAKIGEIPILQKLSSVIYKK